MHSPPSLQAATKEKSSSIRCSSAARRRRAEASPSPAAIACRQMISASRLTEV
jgi:hypothetical protein